MRGPSLVLNDISDPGAVFKAHRAPLRYTVFVWQWGSACAELALIPVYPLESLRPDSYVFSTRYLRHSGSSRPLIRRTLLKINGPRRLRQFGNDRSGTAGTYKGRLLQAELASTCSCETMFFL